MRGGKGKESEHRACMQRELCAQTADPAKCEAQAKERMAQRDDPRGVQGQDGRGEACMREQRGKT